MFSYDTKREVLDRLVLFESYGYPADFLQTYQAAVRALTPPGRADGGAGRLASRPAEHPGRRQHKRVGRRLHARSAPVNQVDITIPEPAFEIPAATPASLEQGRQAIDRAIVAAGGAAKLAGLKAYFEKTILDATIQGMDLTFTIEKTVVFPDKIHTVQKTPFGNMTSVVAGDNGWADSPRGKKDMPRDDLAKAREELRTDIVGILREPDAFRSRRSSRSEVDGKACLPVYVTGVGEDYRIIFLNAETGLPLCRAAGHLADDGGAGHAEGVHRRIRDLGGFTMPKALRLVFDDEEFAKGRIEAFTANPKVDPALFVKK